ncbi:MAG: hypothetical protein LRZ85_07000 [Alphaproteobacteria bacterium]|nr:hypothetical protein [Alphaproteobacteria bacterium]MCD8526148.1 hypothetical protein [Alphaproteobacteria bacterium]
MPPIFDKDCKLKVIEYGDHSKSIQLNKGALLKDIADFFRRLFAFSRKA